MPPADVARRALEQAALAELDTFSRQLLGRPLSDTREVVLFVSRLGAVLDVFLRCFVALQKGQQQFRQAVDIAVLGTGKGPVETASSAVELATALFAPQDAGAVSVLENAFKNIMVHQVALLNGLMAGVRSLMAKLSPKSITKQAEKEHRLVGTRALWETYKRIHGDLAEEDTHTFETLFGPQFAKAYAALAGKKRRKSEV